MNVTSIMNNIMFKKWLTDLIAIKYKVLPVKNPERHLRFWFKFVTGRKLDLKHPKTLSEKIQWLKIYDPANKCKTKLVDKLLVRDYVKKAIGFEYLIPLIGTYDNFHGIDFSKLPNEYVIKTNHDSGHNVIIDKNHPVDVIQCRKKFNKWLKQNYAYRPGYEMQYRDIKPKILIEEKINDANNESLVDYKFICLNGDPKCVAVYFNRGSDVSASIYDLKWNKLPVATTYKASDTTINEPKKFGKMIEIAKKLSKDFSFVRVDLYNVNEKIYFGELTFTPNNFGHRFEPIDFDYELGSELILPNKCLDSWTKKNE